MILTLNIAERLYFRKLLVERGPLLKVQLSIEIEKTIALSDIEKEEIEYKEEKDKASYKLNPDKDFQFSIQEIALLSEGVKELDRTNQIDRKNIILVEKILNLLTYI